MITVRDVIEKTARFGPTPSYGTVFNGFVRLQRLLVCEGVVTHFLHVLRAARALVGGRI